MGESYLDFGATGATGGAAAEQLRAKKAAVRVLAIGRTTVRTSKAKFWSREVFSAISLSLRKSATP